MSEKIEWSEFDVKWYKEQYHEIISFFGLKHDHEVEEFYNNNGAFLRHSPNLYFDEKWYLTRYEDVKNLVVEGRYKTGFEHYVQEGYLSKSPHWLFDEEYYKRAVLDVSQKKIQEKGFKNGYDHYLNQGRNLFSQPSMLFEPNLFLQENPEFPLDEQLGAYTSYLKLLPTQHYTNARLSWYFDPEWYLEKYANVFVDSDSWLGPLHHYLTNNTPELYDPNPYFSEKFYSKVYEDVASAVKHGSFRNCYEHFIKFGQYELRQPSEDAKLRQYAENPKVKSEVLAQKYSSIFIHYIAHGGVVSENGYSIEEIEYISKSVYQNLCSLRLPLLRRAGIDFSYSKPNLSVIMVAHNNFAMTLSALASLRENYKEPIQLILVDSGSSDETRQIEHYIHGADIVRILGNVGFLEGCNQALPSVKSDYTLYLNNDVELMPNAVEMALARFDKDPKAGAVGAKLVRTNGLLQEAGCIVWRDGSVVGYLRDQRPDVPEANYVRSVDFCSAAFLMVKTKILKELSGFDQDYAPAYFEETDLCVRINQTGMEVIYDPAVVVLHYEYGTSGAHESNQMMTANLQKFREKNKLYLVQKRERNPQQILFARSVKQDGKKILFIEDYLPFRHLGSGFTRSNDIISIMVNDLGYDVTVYPIFKPIHVTEDIYSQFPDRSEVMHDKGLDDLENFLQSRSGYYDTIWIARTHNAARLEKIISKNSAFIQGCTIILDTEAIAASRVLQKIALDGAVAQHTKEELIQKEFSASNFVHKYITVSENDTSLLKNLGKNNVSVLGHKQKARRFTPAYTQRRDMLFVGAVHDKDSPNLDSLIWFVNEVLPRIEANIQEDFKFRICGYINPDIDLGALLKHPRVEVVGRVHNMTSYYDTHRIFIAPTRFAAGIPYKIHEAAANALPIVASNILCEQVGWQAGEDIVSALTGNSDSFAKMTVELYENRTLWEKVRRNALLRIIQENEPKNYVERIRSILTVSKG